MTYVLWGAAHSLYTGKLRSYLIKKGLPYRERYPSDPEFAARILPVVKHMVVPVLETPAGDILQDSGDIIDYLEARHAEPVMDPVTPVQQVISALLDGVGSEYLLPLAMHYRWTYRADQEGFLRAEFGRAIVAGDSREERRATAGDIMNFFASFLPNLGVFPETVAVLESRYLDWLDALDEHFQHHPYILGGRPCRGDFGLMASLFAHLGRDPVPAALMKAKAPNVFRWTERMNLAALTDGEYPDATTDYYPDDGVPPTLEPVLALVFRDWTPGMTADVARFNIWAADQASGAIVSLDGARMVHPSLGPISYDFHGTQMTRGSAPHAVWMFQSAQRAAQRLAGDDKARLDAVLDRTNGQALFGLKIDRDMERKDNILVLV